MSINSNFIGLAAEFRVMSELLLRGYNPAKSYLENGADLILRNGKKIEVKSSNKRHQSSNRNGKEYLFSIFGGGRNKQQNLNEMDFMILWCIPDNVFYIVPSNIINNKKRTSLCFCDTSPSAKHRYTPFREKWDLLK